MRKSNALIASQVLDVETVDGVTVREALGYMAAVLAGKVTVSGSTVTFRDLSDSADRVVSTTDSNGQRTAVTLN